MPEGDASLSPVVSVLRDLGGEAATGCLAVRRPDGHVSHLYLAEGRLYAADAPGERPTLGTRLVTYGVVSSRDVFQALDRQWDERGRWPLGEVLVHLERAEPEAVAPHVRALLVDTAADALAQEMEAWQFRPGSEARSDVGDPLDLDALLDELTARAAAWEELAEQLGGPFVTVRLVDRPEAVAEPDLGELAVLDRLHPSSTLPRIALDTGLTLLEVGQHVRRLAEDGVVAVEEPHAEAAADEVAEHHAAPGTAVPQVQADAATDDLPGILAPAAEDAEPVTPDVPESAPVAEAAPEDATAHEPVAASATDEPATHEPVAASATDEPVEAAPEEPAVETGPVDAPTEQPAHEEPTAEEPAAEQPAHEEPAATTAEADTPDTSRDMAADEDPETQAFDTAALLRELASLGAETPHGDDAREAEKASQHGHGHR